MPQIILTYRLKPGVDRENYEKWSREVDFPAIRGLRRVAAFRKFRTTGLFLGEGSPSIDYVEFFDIPDLDGFRAEDLPGEVVQKIMGDFVAFVDDAEFLIAEEVV